jgi:RimJ/RimL family protein N-acetyltransferase
MLIVNKFSFKPKKTHSYACSNTIYYSVFYKKTEIGYILIQNYDFCKGFGDIGYKTFEPYRKLGLTKKYVKCFAENINDLFYIERITGYTSITNKASQRVLEYSGFRQIDEKDGKFYYKKDFVDCIKKDENFFLDEEDIESPKDNPPSDEDPKEIRGIF